MACRGGKISPYIAVCDEIEAEHQGFNSLKAAKAHVEEYHSNNNIVLLKRYPSG